LKNEIFIALLVKKVEERLASLPTTAPHRGPRGQRGAAGRDGKDFDIQEHADTIRAWAKEFALKFEDLSADEIEKLRGPKGRDGRDGKDFSFEENQSEISNLLREFVSSQQEVLKLKFSDLSTEEISQLRGPRGRDGRDGEDFSFEKNREKIENICREVVGNLSDSLKLKFSDLSAEDIEQIRGPRGRDGRDGRDGNNGRDFVFEEHRSFFESLKPKFSDFTPEEVEKLRLHFSDLSEQEKDSLKLRFSDLTDEDRLSLRGSRGPRGQRGVQGDKGEDGKQGKQGPRGLPGISGRDGRAGKDGRDGVDGKDAPYITDIRVEELRTGVVEFIFEFSDGTAITTNAVKLPRPNVYNSVGGAATAGGGSGTGPVKFKTGVLTPGDFVDSPKKATVTFSTPWRLPYAPSQPAGADARFYTIENVTLEGYVINTNSDDPLSGPVYYSTIPLGESDPGAAKPYKSGVLQPTDFGGSPLKANVVFQTPWDSPYVPTQPIGSDARLWSFENITMDGYTINTNSDEDLTGPVYYSTLTLGESS
jgi:hypothetical protein